MLKMTREIDELLTMSEVAGRVKVHRVTLYRKMREGKFPAPLVVCGRYRWKASEIEHYIETSERPKVKFPPAS